ncbi:hypothetical protein [Aestuariibaculum marinum]|uniref:Uncharacterized protein n=1 Tax=Aestuariibaculum marinum TaxID=2683592 RepID=A0A8J6Q014_9FLAO|nr:hypothetical protein [Aestuariibaculum marinum]MBD0822609.1 hypothetical protein [Aestuariibaculum marinum]
MSKANVLKKIEVGNPLINLGLFNLYDKHQEAKNDEQLANFYHHLLDSVEGSEIAEQLTFAMIAYSTGIDINPLILMTLERDEDRN